MSLKKDFLSKVTKTDSCWIWNGSKQPRGYGFFTHKESSERYAHRASHAIFKGPIPEGFDVDHQCNNPSCVRPSHLKAMSRSENLRREYEKVCPNGHKRTKKNVYIRPNGTRECLDCKHKAWRAWKGPLKDLDNFCRNGHPRTPETTRIKSNGARECRVCEKIALAKRLLNKGEDL